MMLHIVFFIYFSGGETISQKKSYFYSLFSVVYKWIWTYVCF